MKQPGCRPGSGVTLITLGDPDRRTGGHLYNRRVLAGLAERGLPDGGPVSLIALREVTASPTQDAYQELRDRRPAIVIIDSIALEPVTPLIDWIQRDLGARVATLMHMFPGGHSAPGHPARRRLLRQVDGIIAVSPDLAMQVADIGADTARIAVVLPGKDGIPFTTGLPVRPLEDGVTRLLLVANWSPSKGVHWAIRAVAALVEQGRRVQLDLVGEIDTGAYGDGILQDFRHLIGAGIVRAHGSLPSESLAPFYAQADGFVLPSRSEGFGTVYAEALTWGLPVVACRVGPVPWLVEPGCGRLVPVDDEPALRDALGLLADDPTLRRAMGRRARRRAARLPTWEESATRFHRIIVAMGFRAGGLGCLTGRLGPLRS